MASLWTWQWTGLRGGRLQQPKCIRKTTEVRFSTASQPPVTETRRSVSHSTQTQVSTQTQTHYSRTNVVLCLPSREWVLFRLFTWRRDAIVSIAEDTEIFEGLWLYCWLKQHLLCRLQAAGCRLQAAWTVQDGAEICITCAVYRSYCQWQEHFCNNGVRVLGWVTTKEDRPRLRIACISYIWRVIKFTDYNYNYNPRIKVCAPVSSCELTIIWFTSACIL